MKQPKIGNYNWTPQQMARVNAQRQARGQEQLLNRKMEDIEYSDDYDKYYKEIQGKSKSSPARTSQYDLQKAEQSNIPISERIKSSGRNLEEKQQSATDSFRNKREKEQAAFRERFRKKQMLPQGMGGMKSGVSSPASSSFYARGMA
jgi:murein L,D-transpeptidase YcbB/YkuD